MAGLLAEFLRGRAGVPFAWGTADCLLLLTDWAMFAFGRDPGAPYRGAYSDEQGACRIIEAGGGEAPLLENAFLEAALSLQRRTEPDLVPGDVGLVGVPRIGTTGGIWTGRHWAMQGRDGLALRRLPLIIGWTICPRCSH